METMKFPFSDAPNTACFTCCHVLEENKPILYVSHDEDGYWQFLCGGNHKEEDVRVVSLASILRIDETRTRFPLSKNQENKNRPCKINETMQISAIKSIENMLKNAIQIT